MTSPAGGMSVADLVLHCQLPDECVLDAQVTSDRFHEVSCSLSQWRRLAPILGISQGVVEDIEMDYRDEERKRSGFLVKWTQEFSVLATYRRLIEALLKIKRTDDALKICELFKANVPTHSNPEPRLPTKRVAKKRGRDSANVPTQTRNFNPEPRLLPPSPKRVAKERGRDKASLPLDTNKVLRFLKEEYFPAGKARELGVCLDIPQGRLSTFETNHPNNADRVLMDVITYWIDNDGEASWDKLATALEKCEHAVMAKKIQRSPAAMATCTPPRPAQPLSSTDYIATPLYSPQANQKPTLKDLTCELYNTAASQWELIGIQLQLDSGVLDTFKRKDDKEALIEVLKMWLKTVDPPPTWKAIIDAVEIFDPSLAASLTTKYGT